jgi:hypothetical protein
MSNKIYVYDVEVFDEISSETMNYEFEYEIWEGDEPPTENSDPDLIQAIVSSISIVPTLREIKDAE